MKINYGNKKQKEYTDDGTTIIQTSWLSQLRYCEWKNFFSLVRLYVENCQLKPLIYSFFPGIFMCIIFFIKLLIFNYELNFKMSNDRYTAPGRGNMLTELCMRLNFSAVILLRKQLLHILKIMKTQM